VAASSPDVLVAGGGPAGATAARRLAQAGLRVLLVDRARFPRNKPCGGAISVRALRRFPYLAEALPRIDTHLISRLHLESPDSSHVLLTSDRPAALMIRRVAFDDLLLTLAREAGAHVVEGAEIAGVEETAQHVALRARDGRQFEAPYLIAADGVNSVVARRLGLNRGWPPARVAIDMMEETPAGALKSLDPEMLWVAYGYGGGEGYAYVFPKAAHVNVGIGYVLEYFRSAIAAQPFDLQRTFVDRLNARGVLAGPSSRSHFTPFLIPVGGPLVRTTTSRVLLAGDAGGFVNAITAEGIYYAMVSGDLAAAALVSGRRARYERMWRREIGAELRDAVLVQRHLLTSPERIDALVRTAAREREIAAVLIRYAMGEVTYQYARRKLLMRSPMLGVKLLARYIGA
jgi:geranylgeranyl reductase family protein